MNNTIAQVNRALNKTPYLSRQFFIYRFPGTNIIKEYYAWLFIIVDQPELAYPDDFKLLIRSL